LPEIVISTDSEGTIACQPIHTTDIFKRRLDKFWIHQDVLYDYRVRLTGIGSRGHSSQINPDDNIVL